MRPPRELVVTNHVDDDLSVSLYQEQTGDYMMWIKVGAAMLELKESQFEDFFAALMETMEDIREHKETAGV